jgi:hypothetical protein
VDDLVKLSPEEAQKVVKAVGMTPVAAHKFFRFVDGGGAATPSPHPSGGAPPKLFDFLGAVRSGGVDICATPGTGPMCCCGEARGPGVPACVKGLTQRGAFS